MDKNITTTSNEEIIEDRGVISRKLISEGIENESLENDHLGIEVISVEPASLYAAVSKLKSLGLNYLECQGGYDEGPGKRLVSFYHFIEVGDVDKLEHIQEVRVKVFLERDADLSVPSLYSLFKGSDWQERETFDMFGINFANHPCPKRLLMPEDWRGWPLRKDYIQPDFYELQDAY